MAINTRETVNERSTIDFEVSFYDETGAAVTPNEIEWTLTDDEGTVINSREDVSVTVPAATIHVTLSGDDCVILSETDSLMRLVHLIWFYDSSLGSDFEGNEEIMFKIKNIRHAA
jgi:hypothetical protein